MKGYELRVRKLLNKEEYLTKLREMNLSEEYIQYVASDWYNTERDREVHGPYFEWVKKQDTLNGEKI